jgi:broad-specificity NMP kinase
MIGDNMKVVAIGGEPGSGKTTLMKEFMKSRKFQEYYNEVKLVPYLQSDNIYVLGKYEENEVFAGTDRMSMACQPEVIKFLDNLPKEAIVFFEGDRLFNSSFLEHCVNNYDLEIIYLQTDRAIRKLRYEDRGSDQNEKWLAGRETKISNILTNFNLLFYIYKYNNNNLLEQQTVLDALEKVSENKIFID